MTNKQKLELTWIGKGNVEHPESRILIEEQEISYHASKRHSENDIFENKLIYGDNLLALKALEQEYVGKVKCVFIDPPYNTQNALLPYDDGLEHSRWLSLISERLVILKKLMAQDSSIWITIDDNEAHYLKVLLDETFGRQCFVADITYERSGSAGLGQGGEFVNTTEHLLVYKKGELKFNEVLGTTPLEQKTMQRYNKVLKAEGTKTLVRSFESKSNSLEVKIYKHDDFAMETISLAKFEDRREEIKEQFVENFDRLFRTNNVQKENAFQNDLMQGMEKKSLYTVEYTPSRGKYKGQITTLYYYNAELFAWLKDTSFLQEGQIVKTNKLTTVWTHADIPKADLANEGGVEFPRSKKPEHLIRRILSIATNPNDIVLDSFAGSGTTGAVAHKMKRRWVMVELNEHCQTHIVPRLKNVIDGTDQGGVSKVEEWNGGGGFRYYKLAPSLLAKDKWGNLVINKDYDANMLAAAVCKHEGFTYSPSETEWWAHGYSTETDFIYVTTQTLTEEQLLALSEDVGNDRTLLVCCAAYKASAAILNDKLANLTVNKIPNVLFAKCEWSKDDYSLNINQLPIANHDDDEITPSLKNKTISKEVDLFSDNE